MPTPDEVFEQVLAEETAKGSSPAVAQARAKAARVRAQRGSKDPNKPDSSTAPPPASNPQAKGGGEAATEAACSRGQAGRWLQLRSPQPRKLPPRRSPQARRRKKAVGNGSTAVPERVQRLLAVVKPEAIQKVERQPMDRVNVWPHLMAAEFVSLLVVLALLTFFSIAADAPLRELANFNQTPNPSKAPWYFLGLQELLRYFHPQVAGVTIPTVIIIGLDGGAVHRPQPIDATRRPQARDRHLQLLHADLRGADDPRYVLQRSRVQLRLPLGRRLSLLRVVKESHCESRNDRPHHRRGQHRGVGCVHGERHDPQAAQSCSGRGCDGSGRSRHAAAAGTTDVAPVTASPAAATSAGSVTVEKVPEKKRKPLTPEQLAVSRRQFLNRAWSLSFLGFLGFFGMSSLSFLWPKLTGGFGTKINAGNYDDILAQVGPEGGFLPLFIAEGRFWLTYYEGTGDAPVYTVVGAVDTKLQALYRKCVHLGCSVPHCEQVDAVRVSVPRVEVPAARGVLRGPCTPWPRPLPGRDRRRQGRGRHRQRAGRPTAEARTRGTASRSRRVPTAFLRKHYRTTD